MRVPPPEAAGLSGGRNAFDPYQPPAASPSVLFAASSFLRRLWSAGLAPAVRKEVEAASLAALRECLVGRCRFNPVEVRVESAWFQLLKLKYDEPLSHFAFNFNLRHCSLGGGSGGGDYHGLKGRDGSKSGGGRGRGWGGGGDGMGDDDDDDDGAAPPAISVHIRRGDACMRWAQPGDIEYVMGRPCYRTEHYVRAAEALAAKYGATVALLATDDPGVLDEVRRLSATAAAAAAPSDDDGGAGGGSSSGGSEAGSGGGSGGGSRARSGLRWCQVSDPARAAVGGTQWTNAYTSDQPVDWNTFPAGALHRLHFSAQPEPFSGTVQSDSTSPTDCTVHVYATQRFPQKVCNAEPTSGDE